MDRQLLTFCQDLIIEIEMFLQEVDGHYHFLKHLQMSVG